MTEKLSKIGYRPAACATAQIRISIEMRVTGDSEETGQIKISIDGKNGSRTGHYDKQISAREFHGNHTQMIQSMGVGMASVMAQVDPEYPKKVLEASGLQPQDSGNQKTVCTSYRMFMSDKELNLPDQFNHMLDEFFTEAGYRPTTCEEAQIALTSEMRFVGDVPVKVNLLFTAKSAERTEKYHMEFTDDEWQKNRENVMAQMGLGMMIVMDKIEPGFMAKYGEWVQKQGQTPGK